MGETVVGRRVGMGVPDKTWGREIIRKETDSGMVKLGTRTRYLTVGRLTVWKYTKDRNYRESR